MTTLSNTLLSGSRRLNRRAALLFCTQPLTIVSLYFNFQCNKLIHILDLKSTMRTSDKASGNAAPQPDQAEIETESVRIAVKLPEGIALDDDTIRAILDNVIPGCSRGTSILPLITSQQPAVVAALVARAASLDPNYKPPNFATWLQIRFEPRVIGDPSSGVELDLSKQDDVNELVRLLQKSEDIESVHVLRAGPPPMAVPDPVANPRFSQEPYHSAAPVGIDALWAWALAGGDGAGIGFVDVEQGWNLDHEDLHDAAITLISGANQAYFPHGTAVLGEVLMVNNTIGGVGLAPNCKGRVISLLRPEGYNIVDTIIDALVTGNMQLGDVLLLEAQETDPVGGKYFWPVEIVDSTYETIELATRLGIVVVEAGCNGSYDLDAYVNAAGKQIFDRSSTDFRDSGAIMVGAASSAVPHSRLSYSNFGSRIDLYGWGENVDTASTDLTGADNNLYDTNFNGTSSASPIVAGAAIIVQGVSQAHLGQRLAPLYLRALLADHGTLSANPALDLIGRMPDLRKTLSSPTLNLAPDIYLRDCIGDIGNPNTSRTYLSPDIITLQSPISNPQSVLGQSTGVVVNNHLVLQDVLTGQHTSIYVRISNRGGMDGKNVSVSVYWSPPATMQTPNLWQLIGTAEVTSVVTGRVPTVSSDIPWSAAPDHYGLIAVCSHADKPAPALTDLEKWDKWLDFLSKNNCVAWRNFNVVSSPAAAGAHRFPVFIPGASDSARSFVIESFGSLPRGSTVHLEMPLDLLRSLGVVLREVPSDECVGNVPLHPFARSIVGSGVLAADSVAKCTLAIQVPQDTYEKEGVYEFAVSQLFEGKEMGRVTWHFGKESC